MHWIKYVNIFLCSILVGCTSTTNKTPDIITSDSISYDEYGNLSGGILGIEDGKYFIITAHTVDLYNALVKKYGKSITPEVKENDGIIKVDNCELYKITPKYMKYFLDFADQYNLELFKKGEN